MRRSYAGVSKVLLRQQRATSGTVDRYVIERPYRSLPTRRAWESSLQTGHEHGRYDGRVQAAMRSPLGRVR